MGFEPAMITTILVAMITAMVGPIVVEWTKNRLKKKDEESLIKEMEADVAIMEQLDVLLKNIDCDRIWILQFHNGGHYYSSGISIKKFSIFYEATAPGIAKIQQQFQNVPTSFFSRSLCAVNKNGFISVPDFLDSSGETYGLSDIALQTGAKCLYSVAFKTPSGKFHGAIGAEYVRESYGFTEGQIEEIHEASAYISGILSAVHRTK